MASCLLLLGAALCSAETAVVARYPKAPGRRALAHAAEVRDRRNHLRFRHNPHSLPILNLNAHNPEKFKTVHNAKNYKFK